MTQNQIAYLNFLESKRHNVVGERETGRHNVAGEAETQRHNLVGESETARHNQQTEILQSGTLTETIRHNKQGESETSRHNLATESQALKELSESKRHNKVTEKQTDSAQSEIKRHNMTTETESGRHNLAQESIDSDKNAVQREAIAAENERNRLRIQSDQTIAEMNNETTRWRTEIEQAHQDYRNRNDNVTKTQIANEDRDSREAENAKNRLAEAIRTGDTNAINREKNAIEKLKAEIQEQYNNQKIGVEYYKATTDFLNGILDSVLSIAKVGKNKK